MIPATTVVTTGIADGVDRVQPNKGKAVMELLDRAQPKKRKSGDGVVGQSPAQKRKSGDGVVAAPMEIADQSHSEIESDSRAGSRAGRPLRLIPARGADCESERQHRKGPGGFGSTDALSPAVGGVVESTPAVGRESDSSRWWRIRQ